MIKALLLILLALSLNAANPAIYSALGDVIYNNVEKIQKLQNIPEYTLYKEEIDSYVKSVKNVKELGFAIESGKSAGEEKKYLRSLRELSKKNDYFLRTVELNYKISLDEKNRELFIQTINSGLIDTQQRKDQIIDFYFQNCSDMNATGIIKVYLEEDKKLKKLRDKHLAENKAKKLKEMQRIKRLREKDIQAQKELERKLEAEVQKKKLEIRQNQKSELKR